MPGQSLPFVRRGESSGILEFISTRSLSPDHGPISNLAKDVIQAPGLSPSFLVQQRFRFSIWLHSDKEKNKRGRGASGADISGAGYAHARVFLCLSRFPSCSSRTGKCLKFTMKLKGTFHQRRQNNPGSAPGTRGLGFVKIQSSLSFTGFLENSVRRGISPKFPGHEAMGNTFIRNLLTASEINVKRTNHVSDKLHLTTSPRLHCWLN